MQNHSLWSILLSELIDEYEHEKNMKYIMMYSANKRA